MYKKRAENKTAYAACIVYLNVLSWPHGGHDFDLVVPTVPQERDATHLNRHWIVQRVYMLQKRI